MNRVGSRKVFFCMVVSFVLAFGFDLTSAEATLISFTNYDVLHTRGTGSGSWTHNYTGTITSNGDGTVNETGGHGTLNDGFFGTSKYNTQLFQNADNPYLILYLDQFSSISDISLYSFNDRLNWIPGNIVSVDITINGMTQTFTTSGFGDIGRNGFNVNEFVNLNGSSLSSLVTNQVILSHIISTGSFSALSSISEISLNGVLGHLSISSVPEPSTMLLFGAGLAGLGILRRRFKE